MRGDYKYRCRLDFQLGFLPNLSLKFHAAMEFLEPFALPNDDSLAHDLVCAPSSSRNRGFSSACLVASQSPSIPPRGKSLTSRPLFCASLSIPRNRRENFALAFFNAISGSTFKNRERFTEANSKSPSSSSIFCWTCSFDAFFSSSVSSANFSIIPPASSQSNPMLDALRV